MLAGDLGDLRGREDGLGLERDGRVQVADDTDNGVVTGQLGRGVLAHVRLGLVIDGLDLERPAGDGLLLVGFLDGELDGVLDAQTKGGEVTGQRRDDADLGNLVAAGARPGVGASGIAAATAGEGERCDDQRAADHHHGTLRHVSSC